MLSPDPAKYKSKEDIKDDHQYKSNHQSAHHAGSVIGLNCGLSREEKDSCLQFKPGHDKSEEQNKSTYS